MLSGLADIGRTHLSAIERSERKPAPETLYGINVALEVKMSDIVKAIETEIEKSFNIKQYQTIPNNTELYQTKSLIYRTQKQFFTIYQRYKLFCNTEYEIIYF